MSSFKEAAEGLVRLGRMGGVRLGRMGGVRERPVVSIQTTEVIPGQ